MSPDTFSIIRQLAKSNKYQTIYSLDKPIGIRLFKNDSDLTQLQISFLNYLNFYSQLFLDIYTGDVDEFVLTDTIFEDSYMYYKNKKNREENKKKDKTEKKISPIKDEQPDMKSQWIFRKPRKSFSSK